MAETPIIMYGTTWCGDCRRARRIFERHNIPYEWVNIDQDCDAEAYVKQVNHGNRSVPTIVFPDGSLLVEPSNAQLLDKLGVQAS